MQDISFLSNDLVLVGGGHSHLALLRRLCMRPRDDIRVTLVSESSYALYSGMIPGTIAGYYKAEQACIDLRKLCQAGKVRLLIDSAIGIDSQRQELKLAMRPALRYDVLSINCGSRPALTAIDGANRFGIAVKPLAPFLAQVAELVRDIDRHPRACRITIVGGGAAAVEVTLALQRRLTSSLRQKADAIELRLVCASETLLADMPRRAGRIAYRELTARGVVVQLASTVTAVEPVDNGYQLQIDGAPSLQSDWVAWCLYAAAPTWLQDTAECHCIARDDRGFVTVNDYLQSTSHRNIFAAGDIAQFVARPLAKSGVYAVREGPVIADNLLRAIDGRALKRFRPQRNFLALLGTADDRAIGVRWPFVFHHARLWTLKQWIDQRFVARYSTSHKDFSTMAARANSAITTSPPNDMDTMAMRCGGCAAKVPAEILERVLNGLSSTASREKPTATTALVNDDAAVIDQHGETLTLQTIDYFRSFIDDPYLLGFIAANHCLGDIYAMGAKPVSALALASVPHGKPAMVANTLAQLLHGANDCLQEHGIALLGGHSNEAAELGFGLTVNGKGSIDRLLKKSGLLGGQQLILTRPIGTGILLAANMHGVAEGRDIDRALAQMQRSNASAADILIDHGASACTDITGFGLIGHVLEMLRGTALAAQIYVEQVPLFSGSLALANDGWRSSLYQANRNASDTHVVVTSPQGAAGFSPGRVSLMFDPQTAGGLLAGIAVNQVGQCLADLHAAGYCDATIIGAVTDIDLKTNDSDGTTARDATLIELC